MNFKSILAWIKTNLVVVICSVVILAALPVSAFFSTNWLKGIIARQEKAANDELKKVQGAEMTYALTQFDPSGEAVTLKGAPNRALIDHFRSARERGVELVGAVAKEGEDFNRGVGSAAQGVGRTPFEPLVAGLFPKVVPPAGETLSADALRDLETAKIAEMEDALLGRRGKPNPFQQLLEGVRAGGPVSPTQMLERLNEVRQREVERVTAGTRQPTPDEQNQIKQVLSDQRVALLQAHARNVSVYAAMDLFAVSRDADQGANASANAAAASAGLLPAVASLPIGRVPERALNTNSMFMYQWDLWMLRDIFAAVRLANTTPQGQPTSVDRSVVKRLISLELLNPAGMKDPNHRAEPGEEVIFDPIAAAANVAPTATVPGLVPVDLARSVTGRGRGSWNNMYELRKVRLRAVVASARIQEFMDAINRTNFMSISAFDVRAVDAMDAARQGFYYGPEHVLEVSMTIETVWLKSWIVPLMPNDIRTALEIPLPAEEATGEQAGGQG